MKTLLTHWRVAWVPVSVVTAFGAGAVLAPFSHRPTPLPDPCPSPAAAVERAGAHGLGSGAPAFSWSQMESTNYRAFVTQLRLIGCPKATVADIVMADLLAAGQLDVESRNQFWSLLASALPDRALAERAVRAANELLPDLHLALTDPGPSRASTGQSVVPSEDRSGSASDAPPVPVASAVLMQEKVPLDIGIVRTIRKYRDLRLSPQEAEALAALEGEQSEGSTLLDSIGGAPSAKDPRQEAVRELLGEDRFQEYERLHDSRYVRLQEFLDDRMTDSGEIVATYEALKSLDALGDPTATAEELAQRFGNDAGMEWLERADQTRPGFEGAVDGAMMTASESEVGLESGLSEEGRLSGTGAAAGDFFE